MQFCCVCKSLTIPTLYQTLCPVMYLWAAVRYAVCYLKISRCLLSVPICQFRRLLSRFTPAGEDFSALFVFAFSGVCVCVCIYIYIYAYTHTHTHTRKIYLKLIFPKKNIYSFFGKIRFCEIYIKIYHEKNILLVYIFIYTYQKTIYIFLVYIPEKYISHEL